MRFATPLVRGRLLRRYKRFLVDVALDGGPSVVAHCTNTGRLLGCLREGAPVLLEPADRPGRKLLWTWKMVRVGRTWVAVDTAMAVPLVQEAIRRGLVPELGGFERAVREVAYGAEGRSRIDLLLSRGGRPTPGARGPRAAFRGDDRVYVEMKSTTLAVEREGRRVSAFPDAVTERGRKHLEELMHVVRRGQRAAVVLCAMRSDVRAFTPADDIDPAWGRTFRRALRAGVEAYAFAAHAGPRRVHLARPLPILL